MADTRGDEGKRDTFAPIEVPPPPSSVPPPGMSPPPPAPAGPGVPYGPPTGPLPTGTQPPLGGLPPSPGPIVERRGTRRTVVLLIVGAVAVAGLAGVAGRSLLNNATSRDTLEAKGAPIENAADALSDAEGKVAVRISGATTRGEVNADGSVSCWFSYPEGSSDPDDFLACGPLAFADSEPDTHWLQVPVRFRKVPDGTRARVGDIDSLRTVAPSDGEELRRPDGQDAPGPNEIDVERPDAPPAGAGAVGVVPSDAVMVDLTEPDDGRLAGIGYEWELLGYATSDRVRLKGEGSGPVTVFSAPDGHHWQIFEMTEEWTYLTGMVPAIPTPGSDDEQPPELDDASLPDLAGFEREHTVVVDDDRLPLEEVLVETAKPGDSVFAALVPDGAEKVALAIDDGVAEQSWSFTRGERSDDAPDIFYRDPDTLAAKIDEELTLPYGARDLNPLPGLPPLDLGDGTVLPGSPGMDLSWPFGEQELTLQINEARLHYGIQVLRNPEAVDFDDPETIDFDVHTASGLDRALLYLADVQANWGTWEYIGYRLAPEDTTLVLPDGTEIAATRVSDGPFGNSWELETLSWLDQPIFTNLVWDVPAGIETATLRATLRAAEEDTGFYEIYFQDTTIEVEIAFEKG